MTLSPTWIGIDVSKSWLDIDAPASGLCRRIANKADAIAAFAATLPKDGTTIVLEATGAYDTTLRHELAWAGIGFARVNPQRARDFARATGRLAKTDALDAAMLAQMGSALKLHADALPDPGRERLGLLSKRRDQLVGMRTQEKLRRTEAVDPFIVQDMDRHRQALDQALDAIEAEIDTLVKSIPQLAQDRALIRTMPGIGPVTATVLLALMPELGQRSSKQIAALAGLAPINRDSGVSRGKRSIGPGRRRVCKAAYMAAVASLTSRSPLRASYDRLRQAGKPAKVALIALARKIIVTLNAMMKTRTPFHS